MDVTGVRVIRDPDVAGGIHVDGEDRDAAGGGAASFVQAVRRQQEHLRVRVLEEETKLVFLVARIERRRRAGDGRREERDHRRQPVRQRHPDSIAPADTRGRQRRGERVHLVPQAAVADPDVLFGHDDGGLPGGSRVEQPE